MKAKDITSLSVEDLRSKITEEKASLNKSKIGHAVSPLENPSLITKSRKLTARLQTELTKKK
jgi:large subunit ribosomal protein L29